MISFLIGPARSGKSTFTKEWQNPHMAAPRVVVNADQIRLALTGRRYFGPAEPMIQGMKLLMIRTLHNQGYHVLVDGTHTTESSIMDLLYIDNTAIPIWIPDRQKYLDNPDEIAAICKQRARATDQEDLFPVIDRMIKQAAELAKNFDSKLYCMREKAAKYNPNRSQTK